MTYAELGALFGCSPDAARARGVRRGWRRQIGNDGIGRFFVPDGEDLSPRRSPNVRVRVTTSSPPTSPVTSAPTCSHDPELLQRLDWLQAELVEMATKLGATDALVAELRADRDRWQAQADAWRAQAETAQQQQVQAAQQQDELRIDRDTWRAQAERLLGDSETMRERMVGTERDRDQALERLNHNIDRLDRVQAEHHAEIAAVRDQLAKAEHDRDRLTRELETHLRLPWWRRLFA